MPTPVLAVIFDLDGVIIDSNPEIVKFWHLWAAKSGIALTSDNIVQHIYGRKGTETIDALFSHVTNKVKKQIIEEAIAFDSNMNPSLIKGVYEFIQLLLQKNIPIGLVTSSYKKRAVAMLEKQNLGTCIQMYVTAEDVSKGKPDPAPYLVMAAKLNIPPQSCLVFEDAISGVISATSAGMHVIGIGDGEAKVELTKYGAEEVISDFTELGCLDNFVITKTNSKQYQLVESGTK